MERLVTALTLFTVVAVTVAAGGVFATSGPSGGAPAATATPSEPATATQTPTATPRSVGLDDVTVVVEVQAYNASRSVYRYSVALQDTDAVDADRVRSVTVSGGERPLSLRIDADYPKASGYLTRPTVVSVTATLSDGTTVELGSRRVADRTS
jgi:hypothetical protein